MKKYIKFIPFLLTIILRIPDFFQPYWYTDTGIYSAIGQSLNRGGILYKNIIDNKPLFIYYVYAFLERLPFSLMYSTQFVSLIFALLTEYLIYKISLIKFNNKIALINTFIFTILIGSDLLHTNGANAETFFIFFAALSVYVYIKREKNYKYIYIAGLILGLGVLFKVSVLFDGFFLVLYIFLTDSFLLSIKKIFTYTLGIITPIFIFLFAEFLYGNFYNTVYQIFLNNFTYVNTYNKFYMFSFVELDLLVFIILVILIYILYKKKIIDTVWLFLLLWVFSDALIVIITGRPYIHYLIQLALPITFLFGYIIYYLFSNKFIQGIILIFSFVLLTSLYMAYFFRNELSWQISQNFQNTIPYYTNFYLYSLGYINKKNYYSTFIYNTNVIYQKSESSANINYRMASLLDSLGARNKEIFIAANFPWVYYMSDSYTINYYTTDFMYGPGKRQRIKLTKSLYKNKPKIILFYEDGYTYNAFSTFVRKYYTLVSSKYGAKVYKLRNS